MIFGTFTNRKRTSKRVVSTASPEFETTKDYDNILHNKIETFRMATGTKKSLMLTMIASAGLQDNLYSRRLQKVVILDDLFA